MYMSKKINNSKVALKIGGALVIPAMFGTYVSNSCSGMDFKWIFNYPALWYETFKNYVYYDVYLSIYRKIFGFNADLKQKIYAHVCNYGKKFGFEPASCDNKAFSAESDTGFVLEKKVNFLGTVRGVRVCVQFDNECGCIKFFIKGVFDDRSFLTLENPKFEDGTKKLVGEVRFCSSVFYILDQEKQDEEKKLLGASPMKYLFEGANRAFIVMKDLSYLDGKKGVTVEKYVNQVCTDFKFVFDEAITFKNGKGEKLSVNDISFSLERLNAVDFLRLDSLSGQQVKTLFLNNYDSWDDYLALRQAIFEQLGINFGNSIGNVNSGYAPAPAITTNSN